MPAFLSLYPFVIVATVRGPGAITPESEIPTIVKRNVKKLTT
jgi:hypothetical protein